jgi:RNA polymerase subunit RPABC4/transcription elongation factor Spt4
MTMPNPTCPVCGKPERVIEYRHLQQIVTDCENAECPMCTDGWLDWREMYRKLVVDIDHEKLYD